MMANGLSENEDEISYAHLFVVLEFGKFHFLIGQT